jgi:hypothetical protein
MPLSVPNLLLGRVAAESAGVDRQRATQLAVVFSSGLLDVPAPVGLVLTRTVAQREAAAAAPAPVPRDGAEPSPGEPDLLTVPDVQGQPRGDAETALEAAGFTNVLFVGNPSSEGEVGVVVDQAPVPGAQIASDNPVILYVGVGPGLVMPNLIAMPQGDAMETLGDLGLVVDNPEFEASGAVVEGHVVGQDPECGIQVQAGDPVTLTISSGPGGVPINDDNG